MSRENGKQNVQIAELRTEMKDFKSEFNRFRDNEFQHFKNGVDAKFNWILGLVIIGILIPIVLYIIK